MKNKKYLMLIPVTILFIVCLIPVIWVQADGLNKSSLCSLFEIDYGDTDISYHKQQPYISSTDYGMQVTDSSNRATEGSLRLKQAIDLSAFTKDDYIAEVIPYESKKIDGVYNSIVYCQIKLIDVNDSRNYVYIKYMNNVNCACAADGSLAQSWATYVLVYSTGMRQALLPNENPNSAFDSTTRSGFYTSKIGNGWDAGKLKPYSMRYDVENKKVYGADGDAFTLVSNFEGFSSDKVYIEITWQANSIENGIIVKSIGGIDCQGTNAVDIGRPIINLNCNDVCDENRKISLHSVSAYDMFDGDISGDISYSLKYEGQDKSNYIKGKEICLMETGDYVLTATVTDSAGNSNSKSKVLNVPDFYVDSPYYAYYFIGETIQKQNPKANVVGITDVVVNLFDSGHNPIDIDGGYTFDSVGEYTVEYSATEIYTSKSAQGTSKIIVKAIDLEKVILKEGQGLDDIDFDIDNTIDVKGITLYSKTDLGFECPLSVSNLKAGEYFAKIQLLTDGRDEPITLFRGITVETGNNINLPSNSYKNEYKLNETVKLVNLGLDSAVYTVKVRLYFNKQYYDFKSEIVLDKIGFYTVCYTVENKQTSEKTNLYFDFEVVE